MNRYSKNHLQVNRRWLVADGLEVRLSCSNLSEAMVPAMTTSTQERQIAEVVRSPLRDRHNAMGFQMLGAIFFSTNCATQLTVMTNLFQQLLTYVWGSGFVV